MCEHVPSCPGAAATDRAAARVVAARPEQGWSLLCNGVIAFDDGGLILPNGRAVRHQPALCVLGPAALAS